MIVQDKYNGKTSWRDYKAYFNQCALVNNWNEFSKARFLAIRLSGMAQEVLTMVPDGEKISFEDLIAKLSWTKGLTRGQVDTFAAELRNHHRKKNESLQELGEAIRELSRTAPHLPSQT